MLRRAESPINVQLSASSLKCILNEVSKQAFQKSGSFL
jgi:hypothetical protein